MNIVLPSDAPVFVEKFYSHFREGVYLVLDGDADSLENGYDKIKEAVNTLNEITESEKQEITTMIFLKLVAYRISPLPEYLNAIFQTAEQLQNVKSYQPLVWSLFRLFAAVSPSPELQEYLDYLD